MIDPKVWMPQAVDRLVEAFGSRLEYVGLQGSYRRGEATEMSDIDLVVLLDACSLDDLDRYGTSVHALPEGHKACGFICGRPDFAGWPRHELFGFRMDTDDYLGNLDPFLPEISRDDIRENLIMAASNLLHGTTHAYVHGDPSTWRFILVDLLKSAFFALRIEAYLQSGTFHRTKAALLESLGGTRREILTAGLEREGVVRPERQQNAFALLLEWSGAVLRSESAPACA